jgi:hypothetical protein
MATLAEKLPYEFQSYVDAPSYKHRDVKVLKEFDGRTHCWPGPQRNVVVWYLLANQRIVGWNENVNVGWSFPMMKCPPDLWEKFGPKQK